ncbi:modification methylase, partial [mine drainage metagenome]
MRAFRDTWELGIHSYLTYLRDRLLLLRELLSPSGSIFVQIGDENVHHVREILDEVFGPKNFVSLITIRKTTSEGAQFLGATTDYLLFYARDIGQLKFRPQFTRRRDEAEERYDQVLLADGKSRAATPEEREGDLPKGARLYRLDNLTSSRPAGDGDVREFVFQGNPYTPGAGTFKTNLAGLERLAKANRLQVTSGGSLA